MISSNHSGRSRKRFPVAPWFSLFFFWFGLGRSRQCADTPSSLRKLAGLEEVLDESCGNDVEDELAPELDDNPGTTRGATFFCLAQNSFPIVGQMWLLTTGPLVGISVLFAAFFFLRQDCKRVLEDLHRHEEIKIVNVYLCFLTCLHFATGRNHLLWGSWTFRLSLKSFLLSMCIDAPESTTNSRSSSFSEGAGITHASAGE